MSYLAVLAVFLPILYLLNIYRSALQGLGDTITPFLSGMMELAMRLAVKGMMPKNSVGRWSLDRLKVYAGSEHKHQAQKPVALDAE